MPPSPLTRRSFLRKASTAAARLVLSGPASALVAAEPVNPEMFYFGCIRAVGAPICKGNPAYSFREFGIVGKVGTLVFRPSLAARLTGIANHFPSP